MKQKTLVLILAGGQSRRMGQDKAALPFGEGTMLSTLIGRFSGEFDTAVSLREPGQFDTLGLPALVDLHPGQGPLAGLEAAFAATAADWIFLTGTDLPFLSTGLAHCLLQLAKERPDYAAWVLQRRDGKTEPLCGVYSRACVPAIARCLEEGRRSFKGLFSQLPVCFVQEDELAIPDLSRQLDNLNTPEDYERAVSNAV